MEVDLEDVQLRLNHSRQEVQLAIRRYDTEGRSNGDFIANNYLRKFQNGDPERAETAVKIAKETEDEIDKFSTKGGDLISQVATAGLQGDQIVLGEALYSMEDILKHAASVFDDATKRLLHQKKPSHAPSAADLQAQLHHRRMEAAKVGESMININRLAAAVYNLQCDTLKGFRDDNLEVSKEELIRRLQGMLVSIPAEEAFGRFRKLVQDLLAEYLKKVPVLGWLVWIADRVKELAKPKAGTTPGDTDIMLKLLPALRKDQEMINELDRVFQELMAKH